MSRADPAPQRPRSTSREQSALALVRMGRSYDEASRFTGLTVEAVQQLWAAEQTPAKP